MYKKIILMGYMGCGKSILGQKIAQKLDYTFIDLDNYIANKEKLSIPDLFESKGEIYFRKIESVFLKEILNSNENCVISLGGGTPCYGVNIKSIKDTKNAISFYLHATIEELTTRLFKEKNSRPIISHLKTEDELMDFIGKHLFERSFYYNQADILTKTDTKTPDQLTEEILIKLL